MHEFEATLPDWRLQTESALFNRGSDNIGGAEFTVLTRPGIDFVVKIPKHPVLMSGYRLANDEAQEFAIPFIEARDLKLNLDKQKTEVPEAIIQLKAAPFDKAIYDAAQERNPRSLYRLLSQQASIDMALYRKGVFLSDPKFSNFGIDKKGAVKCVDFGGTWKMPENDIDFTFLLHGRGSTHYQNFLILKGFIDRSQKLRAEKPSQAYARTIGMQAKLIHEAPTSQVFIENTEITWDPNLALQLTRIGLDEFVKIYGEPPFSVNADFVRRMPEYLGVIKEDS